MWYFHTLPFLFWRSNIPMTLRLVMILVVERAWNTFPATAASSGALLLVHLVLLQQQFAADARDPLPMTFPAPAPAHSSGGKSKSKRE